MIRLDTHIWAWWVDENPRLSPHHVDLIDQNRGDVTVSVISSWQVAKLVQLGRFELIGPLHEWLDHAVTFREVRLLDLTPRIGADSTQLPGEFHRDPSDQIIVATARLFNCPLLTVDRKILAYPHVKAI
jgi:PIN domain nuclease of toxin-antitoxin system